MRHKFGTSTTTLLGSLAGVVARWAVPNMIVELMWCCNQRHDPESRIERGNNTANLKIIYVRRVS